MHGPVPGDMRSCGPQADTVRLQVNRGMGIDKEREASSAKAWPIMPPSDKSGPPFEAIKASHQTFPWGAK